MRKVRLFNLLVMTALVISIGVSSFTLSYIYKMNQKIMLMKFDMNKIVSEIEDKELAMASDYIKL
jgi:multisubunit Na+/H+ antiporter MnhC subunit